MEPELLIDPELRLMPPPVRAIGRFNRVSELLRMRAATSQDAADER